VINETNITNIKAIGNAHAHPLSAGTAFAATSAPREKGMENIAHTKRTTAAKAEGALCPRFRLWTNFSVK